MHLTSEAMPSLVCCLTNLTQELSLVGLSSRTFTGRSVVKKGSKDFYDGKILEVRKDAKSQEQVAWRCVLRNVLLQLRMFGQGVRPFSNA